MFVKKNYSKYFKAERIQQLSLSRPRLLKRGGQFTLKRLTLPRRRFRAVSQCYDRHDATSEGFRLSLFCLVVNKKYIIYIKSEGIAHPSTLFNASVLNFLHEKYNNLL